MLMTALGDYGAAIDDWSMCSAYIQNGFRPDDEAQGKFYLSVIYRTIRDNPNDFGAAKFPAALEAEAQGIIGGFGDPRRAAFHNHLAASPGWNAKLVEQLFYIVDNAYAPRGSNPHTTGLVFDLDFSIYYNGGETAVGANTALNFAALQSAAGTWLNKYSMQFNFDSYDTSKEIWHLEYRKPLPSK